MLRSVLTVVITFFVVVFLMSALGGVGSYELLLALVLACAVALVSHYRRRQVTASP